MSDVQERAWILAKDYRTSRDMRISVAETAHDIISIQYGEEQMSISPDDFDALIAVLQDFRGDLRHGVRV
jgi:hypothetical protein